MPEKVQYKVAVREAGHLIAAKCLVRGFHESCYRVPGVLDVFALFQKNLIT
jgi:hypothetical protein